MSLIKKTIAFDSPEAATLQTVTGWVSSDGRFYGNDERAARYGGCTHKPCDNCGTLTEKQWIVCANCRAERRDQRFNAIPKVVWDQKTPICLYDGDNFFFNSDDLIEYCLDNEVDMTQLQLMLCERVLCRYLDEDYFDGYFTEDNMDSWNEELCDGIDEFNKTVIDEINKTSTVWEASNKAIILPEELLQEFKEALQDMDEYENSPNY